MRREGSEDEALAEPFAFDFELEEEDAEDEEPPFSEERDWLEGVLMVEMRFCAGVSAVGDVLMRMLGRVRGEYWCGYWYCGC